MTEQHWAPVAELCGRVAADLDRLARASVTRIRRDLAAYEVVPYDQHLVAVAEQQRRRLDALAARRLLAPADLERAAELARRRARQGIAVDVLIGAYHLGDQELWRALCADPGAAAPLLPDVAAHMFELLHAISTVLASAHGDVTRELHSHRATLSHRLLELLLAGRHEAEAARLAETLGMDPHGDFVAAVWETSGADVLLPPEVARELDRAPAPLVHSSQPGAVVVVVQGDGDRWLDELAGRLAVGRAVGTGLRRKGLEGAVASLGDARLALAAAPPGGGATRFGEVWAQACLLAEAQRLEPLVAAAVATARRHPHLAETVLAFAATDMSVARTAESLHLHANSVTYRLQRWAQLTGWDPRTFERLVGSVVACRLALRGSPR
ncbi:helix-turn-helix domain-containing protein [Blastococcus sp. SYSU DS0533]